MYFLIEYQPHIDLTRHSGIPWDKVCKCSKQATSLPEAEAVGRELFGKQFIAAYPDPDEADLTPQAP